MRRLTDQQRQFVQKVAVEKLPPTDAAKAVYPTLVNSNQKNFKLKADEVMAKPQVKREICSILDSVGLSEMSLGEKLFWLVNKPKARDSDRLAGIKLAFQLHGRLRERAPQKGLSAVNVIQLFIKNREERGLPIPAEVLEAMGEADGVDSE